MENAFAVLPQRLLPWFAENARALPWRQDRDPYHVWVSEIMLQQTRVEAVKGYYARFLDAFPTVQALAEASQDALYKRWEGLGYYSRARNLHKTAQIVASAYGGQFPTDCDALLALPGVGAYTVGAIASICFEQPRAAVDGNVLRVTSRFLNDSTPIDDPAFRQRITAMLEAVYPAGACGTFTQSLMELGATVCAPRSPGCGACPLADCCAAYLHGTASSLPVRKPKREKKQVDKTVFLLTCGETVALRRRAPEGLLGSMWEFPNVDALLSADDAMRQAQEWHVRPLSVGAGVKRTHVFTHIVWNMTAYPIPCAEPDPQFTWLTLREIRAQAALPTAFRIFLPDFMSDPPRAPMAAAQTTQ